MRLSLPCTETPPLIFDHLLLRAPGPAGWPRWSSGWRRCAAGWACPPHAPAGRWGAVALALCLQWRCIFGGRLEAGSECSRSRFMHRPIIKRILSGNALWLVAGRAGAPVGQRRTRAQHRGRVSASELALDELALWRRGRHLHRPACATCCMPSCIICKLAFVSWPAPLSMLAAGPLPQPRQQLQPSERRRVPSA